MAAALVSALPIHASAQTPASLSYKCDRALGDTPEGRAFEQKLMNQTHGLASRPSEHVLQLHVAGKTLSFRDQPGDGLDNIAYFFCASHDGYTLIQWNDSNWFTGQLIDERTGNILPGGSSVLFSPDRRAYFAEHQEDGMEGQVWTIYWADGRRAWQDDNYFPLDAHRHPDAYVQLEDPAWTANGELTAKSSGAAPGPLAKLIKVNGKWSWRFFNGTTPVR